MRQSHCDSLSRPRVWFQVAPLQGWAARVFTLCVTAKDFASAAKPAALPHCCRRRPCCNTSTASMFQPMSRQRHLRPALYIPQTRSPCQPEHMGDSLIRSWPSRRHHIPYFIFQGFNYGWVGGGGGWGGKEEGTRVTTL